MDELEYNPDWRRAKRKCPTCQGTGKYRYQNIEYECVLNEYGLDTQFVQFREYCLADIPHEFMVLDFSLYPYDFYDDMIAYVENFDKIRWSGMGYEINGDLGVGKSWAATGILKELIKRGYSGYFMQFNRALKLYEEHDKNRREYFNRKLMDSEVLVLDEVLEPRMSEAQRSFYESCLEDIVRYRTTHCFPTIITTNLTPKKMGEYFPRVYSLLSAKQTRLCIKGDDARPAVWEKKADMVAKGEVAPIF